MLALDATIAAIDAANADDPRRLEGRAFEQVYAERMSARLAALYPDASDLLKIATRAQHLRRWEIARADYEEGRRGYNEWRRACRIHHAHLVAEIMRAHGYDEAAVAHVGALIRKEQLKKDPESQALENIAAIVFLEHYFEEFLEKHREYADDKLVDILGKTLCKMSPKGHAAALALPLPPRARSLVEAAIAREAAALARLAAVAVD
ncbi:DUF4202 domain-containing protein [Methylocystis sp. L43]|uniref:DUF4202 domain-containing protein n=1 Tax=unclassified Methylocystis TaxID=2625913 RepID=UPI0018C2A3FA|nr:MULTISPECIES: DUF4202 domain-containing protein [unclassified Methylocystis]MBG0796675.1 DUF4202 domain-containing protein [Methylocystis sp. L43]MBG0804606.1 DUF4202 domain-containing protein [Methylocystis sp. H15]